MMDQRRIGVALEGERLPAAGLETIRWMAPRLVLPRHLCFRAGALAMLRQLGARRAFVITGAASARASGALDKALGHLTGAGGEAVCYDRIAFEPTWALIREGLDAVRAAGPDWIIGIGGGSVLDAAKLIYVWSEHPALEPQALLKPFSIPPLARRSRLILIPTTAGTGSEVSCSAIVQNSERQGKDIIVSHELLPDIALLDASLTVTLPPALTAATGMDALTHAIEAFVSLAHNPFTDACAAAAIRLILAHLAPAFRDGSRLESRDGMLNAACLAGIAQSNVSVGLTHAIAHVLGAIVTLPHGLLNSVLLVPVMRFNAQAQPDRYQALAGACGFAGLDAMAAAIERFQHGLGLPRTLGAAGAPVAGLRGRMAELSQKVLAEPCARTNPRRPLPEEVARLLDSVLGDDHREGRDGREGHDERD